ncbi:uncharacterized protein G2W53_042453 [Senna tora]|uniref:Uncharacterized protein n=1 Tax=Senna tora TaxID=362788 RepID=A0A834SLW3_9FABA|nr:uncharacterized protein G2W53_042453 [Senna tora]
MRSVGDVREQEAKMKEEAMGHSSND